MNGPVRYTTEPGALDDIAIPAILKPLSGLGGVSPPPAPPRASGTEARVCTDIAARQLVGLRKYGVSVEANPLSQRAWLQHAYEEVLDTAVYLRRLIEQIDRDGSTSRAP